MTDLMGKMGDTIKQRGANPGGSPAEAPAGPDTGARIEAEHRLAGQIGTRIEQEQATLDLSLREATREDQLRRAIAEREAQEARLERLARERIEAERREQASLAARIEAERKLAEQMEARLERERKADELAEQNAARKEQLRRAETERKAQERKLQAERLAARNAARAVAASASPVAAIYARYFRFPAKYYLAALTLAAAAVYAAWHWGHRGAGVIGDMPYSGAAQDAAGAATGDGLLLRLSPQLGDADASLRAVPGRPASAADEKAAKAEREWVFRSGAVREQLKAGAYADVARNAQALSYDFPDHWESWFWLGTAQFALGRAAVAEASLERASKLNPGEPQVWVQRAILAQERNDHAAAVRLLAEARALAPDMPQIYLHLGYSNDALGQFAEAERNYRTFLSLTENNGAYAAQRQSVTERLGNGKR